MQVSITSIKILGHYIHYLENPHLNYQHFRKSDRADALDPSIKQELSERSGETWAGDQLPKVRDVVASLAINPNTVLKAYRELETKGLVVGRPGQGTFIKATLGQITLPELTRLGKSLLDWVSTADESGLDEYGIAALFARVLGDFGERRSSADNSGEPTSRHVGGVA